MVDSRTLNRRDALKLAGGTGAVALAGVAGCLSTSDGDGGGETGTDSGAPDDGGDDQTPAPSASSGGSTATLDLYRSVPTLAAPADGGFGTSLSGTAPERFYDAQETFEQADVEPEDLKGVAQSLDIEPGTVTGLVSADGFTAISLADDSFQSWFEGLDTQHREEYGDYTMRYDGESPDGVYAAGDRTVFGCSMPGDGSDARAGMKRLLDVAAGDSEGLYDRRSEYAGVVDAVAGGATSRVTSAPGEQFTDTGVEYAGVGYGAPSANRVEATFALGYGEAPPSESDVESLLADTVDEPFTDLTVEVGEQVAVATQTVEATEMSADGPSTTSEGGPKVSNRVDVVSSVGRVSDGRISRVEVVLRPAAGSEPIDLSKATVRWIGPEKATELVYGDTAGADTFSTESMKGDSDTVLDEAGDRVRLVIDPKSLGDGLDTGTEAQVTITTEYGTKTTDWLAVPGALSGDAVEL